MANTYSFGKQNFDIFLNYDGEFNNWFNNRMSFNLKELETTENIKIADVVLGEDYWINAAVNENEFVSIKNDCEADPEQWTYFRTEEVLSGLIPQKLSYRAILRKLLYLCHHNFYMLYRLNYNLSFSIYQRYYHMLYFYYLLQNEQQEGLSSQDKSRFEVPPIRVIHHKI